MQGGAEAVAEEVERQQRETQSGTRGDDGVGIGAQRLDAIRHHNAPTRHRWADAEAEEAQARFEHDRGGNAQTRGHDHWCEAVWRYVRVNYPCGPRPERARRHYVLALPQREHLSADDATDRQPVGEPDAD